MPSYNYSRSSSISWAGVPLNYVPSDSDEAGDTKYYGFLNWVGFWIIMEYDTVAETMRYAAGKNGYATSWTGRAGLTYQYYNEVMS